MKRKIPTTMATQHPDHAQKPYWHSEAFISTQHEAKEAFLSFSDLGIDEYKWDWEGKLVDESVLERLFSEYFEYFSKHPLGFDSYLTFRLPNPKVQTEFRIGRAFMNLASAASTAKHFKLPTPPIFEVILPMTESADEIISIQEAYQEIHNLKHPLFRLENILTNLCVIPLFEDVETIINSDKILDEYLNYYLKKFKKLPPYIRPYVARSDPALNHGIVPTVLAIKIALSKYDTLSKKLGIPLYPIIGAASLPFRGGINPFSVERFSDEYKGVKTTTIQSAFRYDYDVKDVKKGIKKLRALFEKNSPVPVSSKEETQLIEIIKIFSTLYKDTVEKISPLINDIASLLPKRRERVQHTGLFGYSRGVGKVRLPRAIGFTGALYSIGIPPEIISTGRGLKKANDLKSIELLKTHYKYLKEDMLEAGRFLNKDNLEKLIKKYPVLKSVSEDVKNLEKLLDITLGPKTETDFAHKWLTGKILEKINLSENPVELIIEAAILRKSLG